MTPPFDDDVSDRWDELDRERPVTIELLNSEDRTLLRELATRLQLTDAGVVRAALRALAMPDGSR
jgi:hypothetical protein